MPQELVCIYWNNPFVWTPHPDPIVFSVGTTDITPPCQMNGDASIGRWDAPGGFAHGGRSPQNCRHELIVAGANGGGLNGVTWWDAVMNWPALLVFTELGDADVNLQFTFILRSIGSVDETIFSFYDGSKGLRSLAGTAQQPSLRKLFHM
jgi:hypothetical protein